MAENEQLDRISAIQMSLDALGRGTYLEIGVDSGTSFVPVKAKRKWGVDPCYTLTRRRVLMYTVLSNLRIRVERVFRMTSDEFFVRKERLLASCGIDVCFVDGLHTYSQALNDVLNALKYLKPRGIILVHDCNPETELMARPAAGIEELISQNIPGWNGAWSGDVWKALVHLRALRNDVKAFVLDCDTGIGVLTKGSPTVSLPYTEADIHAMDYSVLCGNRKTLLDLQPSEYFGTFLLSHLQASDAAG
jgi:hypothetical protein